MFVILFFFFEIENIIWGNEFLGKKTRRKRERLMIEIVFGDELGRKKRNRRNVG